jgi:hypothetical protein
VNSWDSCSAGDQLTPVMKMSRLTRTKLFNESVEPQARLYGAALMSASRYLQKAGDNMDRSTEALATKVRQHWEKRLPKTTKKLKNAGRFYKATQIIAAFAQAEIAELLAKGCPEHVAEELVLSLYTMMEPEQQENRGKGSQPGWNEPISVHLPPTPNSAPASRR